jgi:hypothetical protein
MDLYHIALFLHIVAVIVASGATTITKLAAGRLARARTVGEVLEWHNILMSASKAFPIVLAVFVVTGSYMLSKGQASVWSSGFVVAGLVGVVLLFASGTYLGIKGKGLGAVLEQIAAKGTDLPAPRLVPPPLVAALPLVNTGIALSVVFDMVTKPASVVTALAIVGFGIVLTSLLGMRKPMPAAKPVTAAQ